MPLISNIRHERFAQLLASGKKQIAAYTDAGFSRNSRSAAKLAAQPFIKARVQELVGTALSDTMLDIRKVTNELEKLAFANMLDYIKIDTDGTPTLDFTRLTREQAAAIGEITMDEITGPTGQVTRRTKFKLLDKRGALVDLGKHLGMFIDRKDIRVGGVMFHVNADDMSL